MVRMLLPLMSPSAMEFRSASERKRVDTGSVSAGR